MKKSVAEFVAAHHPLAQSSKVWDYHENPAPKGTKVFIFTAAQNGTPVHPRFWAALKRAVAHYGAHLSVIQLRYKNPTSNFSRSQEGAEVWAPETLPHALNQKMIVNKNLVCVGGIKIVPTASTPLSGFEGFTGMESTIVGHTKLQFKTVPVPGGQMAKIMTTTGACTVANYTNSRAGANGEFHHHLGAVLVELEAGGIFRLRHLSATSDGSFIDLDKLFTPKGVYDAPRPEAIALGDTHVRFTDPGVHAATFGPKGIVTELKPKRIYWHDTCDGYSANPHHDKNPFNAQAKALSGFDDVEAEVREAISYVETNTPDGTMSYLVPDNHGDFLRRWIIKADWKTDVPPIARTFYLRTALAMHTRTTMGKGGTETPSPWPYWVDMLKTTDRVRCLADGVGEARVKGIQMGMHGHQGPNGSRGSIKNIRRLGVKSIIGHSHSPGIDEGCTQVGTSSLLSLEYNGGPSSWLHAHCLVHANGKRQLVCIIKGKYRV